MTTECNVDLGKNPNSIHNVFSPKVDYGLRLDEHDLSLSKEFFWSTKLILFMYRIAPIVY